MLIYEPVYIWTVPYCGKDNVSAHLSLDARLMPECYINHWWQLTLSCHQVELSLDKVAGLQKQQRWTENGRLWRSTEVYTDTVLFFCIIDQNVTLYVIVITKYWNKLFLNISFLLERTVFRYFYWKPFTALIILTLFAKISLSLSLSPCLVLVISLWFCVRLVCCEAVNNIININRCVCA